MAYIYPTLNKDYKRNILSWNPNIYCIHEHTVTCPMRAISVLSGCGAPCGLRRPGMVGLPITPAGPDGTRRLKTVTWAAAANPPLRPRETEYDSFSCSKGRVAPTRSANHGDRGNMNRQMSPTSPKGDASRSLIVRRDVPGNCTIPHPRTVEARRDLGGSRRHCPRCGGIAKGADSDTVGSVLDLLFSGGQREDTHTISRSLFFRSSVPIHIYYDSCFLFLSPVPRAAPTPVSALRSTDSGKPLFRTRRISLCAFCLLFEH